MQLSPQGRSPHRYYKQKLAVLVNNSRMFILPLNAHDMNRPKYPTLKIQRPIYQCYNFVLMLIRSNRTRAKSKHMSCVVGREASGFIIIQSFGLARHQGNGQAPI